MLVRSTRDRKGVSCQSHGDETVSATLHEMDGTARAAQAAPAEGSVAEPCPSSMMASCSGSAPAQESPHGDRSVPPDCRTADPSGPAVHPAASKKVNPRKSIMRQSMRLPRRTTRRSHQLLTSCSQDRPRVGARRRTCPFQLSAESQHHLD